MCAQKGIKTHCKRHQNALQKASKRIAKGIKTHCKRPSFAMQKTTFQIGSKVLASTLEIAKTPAYSNRNISFKGWKRYDSTRP